MVSPPLLRLGGVAISTLFLFTLMHSACGDKPADPVIEPLPANVFSPSTEALLFGSSTRCREAQDCDSHACLFGACAGLITVDEPWLTAVVGERLRLHLASRPGVEERLVPILSQMLADDDSGLAFRGRAARALGEIASPAALDALEARLASAPGSLAEVIAVTLARQGRAAGADLLIELAASETSARAIESLTALGGLSSNAASASPIREAAFLTLLSALSADIDLELNRAAIRSLTRFGDPRAILPLRRFLVSGPESLADEAAAALRKLTNPNNDPNHEAASLGPDPRRWDAYLDQHRPPEPPAYTPRTHRSEDDLDLPTP